MSNRNLDTESRTRASDFENPTWRNRSWTKMIRIGCCGGPRSRQAALSPRRRFTGTCGREHFQNPSGLESAACVGDPKKCRSGYSPVLGRRAMGQDDLGREDQLDAAQFLHFAANGPLLTMSVVAKGAGTHRRLLRNFKKEARSRAWGLVLHETPGALETSNLRGDGDRQARDVRTPLSGARAITWMSSLWPGRPVP